MGGTREFERAIKMCESNNFVIYFVKKFISLTVILMNIQYITTSTEHIYYISASKKFQPSVPRDYNARQTHRSNRFEEESLCVVNLAAFQGSY